MTARLFAMKPTCLLLFVLFVCIWRNAWAAEPVLPLSSGEVKRLIVAVALLDYPVEQAPVREALGISDSVKPAWGGGGGTIGDARGSYWIWPIQRFEGGSYYAIKVIYSSDTMETTGRPPLITAMAVIYFSPATGAFVADPNDFPLNTILRLKPMLKESGLTIKEFTAPETLRKYLNEVQRADHEERIERNKQKQLNQSSQPATKQGG